MSRRKRTKNTTKEQHALYLQYMEGDYTFRSNTINPTLGEKYLDEKWDELCGKLNAMSDGPALSIQEWKKRFTEWKYATRSKYRKIMESRNRTGGGPQTDSKLSDLEEKGLAVWGRAGVTGAADVTLYDGLPGIYTENQGVQIEKVHIDCETLLSIDNFELPIIITTTTAATTVATNVSTSSTPSAIVTTSTIATNVLTPSERPTTTNTETIPVNVSTLSARRSTTPAATTDTKNIFHRRAKNKPLSTIAEKIVQETAKVVDINNSISENLKQYINVYKEIELAKIKLKKEKLNFEINKYKHQHKDFNNNL